jgi:hypothetical protein
LPYRRVDHRQARDPSDAMRIFNRLVGTLLKFLRLNAEVHKQPEDTIPPSRDDRLAGRRFRGPNSLPAAAFWTSPLEFLITPLNSDLRSRLCLSKSQSSTVRWANNPIAIGNRVIRFSRHENRLRCHCNWVFFCSDCKSGCTEDHCTMSPLEPPESHCHPSASDRLLSLNAGGTHRHKRPRTTHKRFHACLSNQTGSRGTCPLVP